MLVLPLALGACSGGGRVNEQLANPVELRNNKQAIGLFRLANPDPTCLKTAVSIGQREGPLYRPQQTLTLQNMAVTNVLEVLLDPGEYHVIGFACYRARSTKIMAEPQGNGLMRRSYASFSVSAGEVVNLGQINLQRGVRSPGIWSSFTNVVIEITDWPLSELERFKSQRPKLFAEMRARLMIAAPKASDPDVRANKCEELRRMYDAGKSVTLPAECAIAPAKAATKT
jgi:hypothetical protein